MKAFEVLKDDKCLCGSNIKYRYCCFSRISEKNFIKATDNAIKNKEYEEAYCFCNADLTKYILHIKRHTEVLLKKHINGAYDLLAIDLQALTEIFDKLGFIVYQGKINVDFNDKFKRIEDLFENKKLVELITFYRVLFIGIFNNDSASVKEILINLNYKEIEKVELLELYFEEFSKELEYSEKIKILNMLIHKEIDDIQKIKYNTILALSYITNDERQSCVKIIENVVKELKKLCLIDLNDKELYILAGAYFYCGLIMEDDTYLNKSIEIHIAILKNTIDTEEISKIYNEVGETYLMLGDYTNAIKHFNLSIENKFNCLSYINIARTMIEIGNISEAYMQICKLNIKDIPEINLIDYLITMGRILVENEDVNKAKEIYYALKELHIEEKMFSGYKNEIIIMLLEQYKGFYEYKKTSSLKKKIDEINNMLELKPNFMGIGVNLNNIISKLISK